MEKIMHAQTVLSEEDIEALKKKTGEPSTKDALAKAVEHYLECDYTKVDPDKRLKEVMEKRNKQ